MASRLMGALVAVAIIVYLAPLVRADLPREKVNEQDGTVLVLVPAGPLTMGSDDSESFFDEKPPHKVQLPAYYIRKYEVTNEQFANFVKATGYNAGSGWKLLAAEWGTRAPVARVNWEDVQAYCRWAGLRLPTEAEWEKAARGPEGLKYPWGNTWDRDRAWWAGNSAGRAHEVGTKPEGASPYGGLDMLGNVCEWCQDWYAGYPGSDSESQDYGQKYRVVRGASYTAHVARVVRNCQRSRIDPANRNTLTGFRCAASP